MPKDDFAIKEIRENLDQLLQMCLEADRADIAECLKLAVVLTYMLQSKPLSDANIALPKTAAWDRGWIA